MSYQAVFKRYEIKFLLTEKQKEIILKEAMRYMRPDLYGNTVIRNIYYDTDTFLLIRRSMEKPVYKEKLRIRSYTKAEANTPVFVELKKKYKSVVYKRRITMCEEDAAMWISGKKETDEKSQISNEIGYFISFYGSLRPKCFLSYEREAYYDKNGGDLRITFDRNIIARKDELTLCSDIWGTSLLGEGMVLMEIKTAGAIPLWLVEILSKEKIYKTSFSKYGKAYEKLFFNNTKGDYYYA